MPEAITSYRRIELIASRPEVVTSRVVDRGSESLVLVEPLQVGFCRSDIREINGTRPARSDFGHEVVGRVKWVSGSSLKIGDLVVLDPHVAVDYRSTAYATLIEVHGTADAVQRAVIRFDQGPWISVGFYVEPLACAVHCTRVATPVLVENPPTVRIIGAGTAGVLLCAVYLLCGARVSLVNRTPDRIEFLRESPLADLGQITFDRDTLSPEATIIATAEFRQGAKLIETLRPTATLIPFGGTFPGETWEGLPIDTIRRTESRDFVQRCQVQGVYGAKYEDFQAAHALISSSPDLRRLLDYLVTHRCVFARAAELLTQMAGGLRVSKAVMAVRCATEEER